MPFLFGKVLFCIPAVGPPRPFFVSCTTLSNPVQQARPLRPSQDVKRKGNEIDPKLLRSILVVEDKTVSVFEMSAEAQSVWKQSLPWIMRENPKYFCFELPNGTEPPEPATAAEGDAAEGGAAHEKAAVGTNPSDTVAGNRKATEAEAGRGRNKAAGDGHEEEPFPGFV